MPIMPCLWDKYACFLLWSSTIKCAIWLGTPTTSLSPSLHVLSFVGKFFVIRMDCPRHLSTSWPWWLHALSYRYTALVQRITPEIRDYFHRVLWQKECTSWTCHLVAYLFLFLCNLGMPICKELCSISERASNFCERKAVGLGMARKETDLELGWPSPRVWGF